MTDLVLDTNILVNAFAEPKKIDHSTLVLGLCATRHNVCVDYGLVIENEYRRNVGHIPLYQQWYKRISQRRQLQRHSSRVPSVHHKRLATLGCHEPTDQTFVGVAYNTDKILISEDSDVGKGPKGNTPPHSDALRYLQNEMMLKVFDASEAVDELFDSVTETQNVNQPTQSNPERRLRVFLCHSSSDKPAVERFYRALAKYGIDAWLDKVSLVPGQDWGMEIPQALRNSDTVIIFLSNSSVTKEGYVQKEIRIALDAADEKPDGTIFIIPARLETCKVPERLTKFHWVDLFEKNGYETILNALKIRANSLGIAIKPSKTK